MSEHYKNTTSSELYTDIKYQKAGEKPLQCDTVIAICIHRSPDTLIPEWEETAALGCSVQNMWLAASAAGLGAYWSTPNVIHHLDTFFQSFFRRASYISLRSGLIPRGNKYYFPGVIF